MSLMIIYSIIFISRVSNQRQRFKSRIRMLINTAAFMTYMGTGKRIRYFLEGNFTPVAAAVSLKLRTTQ